jgi:hypothetical protein
MKVDFIKKRKKNLREILIVIRNELTLGKTYESLETRKLDISTVLLQKEWNKTVILKIIVKLDLNLINFFKQLKLTDKKIFDI